jgi:hypothetical protein
MMKLSAVAQVALVLIPTIAACASHERFVPGTRIPYSDPNKSVLDACEEYRLAVERGDADALMLMAHKQYWEDSGTPSGSDDYGYDGLRNVLATRLSKASDIRYSLRYMGVRQTCGGDLHAPDPGKGVQPCRASVDVLIDASFTLTDALGKPKRPDKRDQNQLVLEWDGHRWLFLSGM